MPEHKTTGNGSLLIAWQLKGKTVLIVGGGEIGSQRIDSILATDGHIDLIAPLSGLHPRTQHFLDQYSARITHINQEFSFQPNSNTPLVDVTKYDMVLTALDDSVLSRRIVEFCRAHRIPVNAADLPDLCDFYFGGQVRDGPLQIMISTNGNAPRLAALIKDKVKNALNGTEGLALTKVGALRAKLKELAPGVGGEVGKKRMGWMSRLCESWSFEELALLDDEMINKVLEGWKTGAIPSYEQVGGIKPRSASKKGQDYVLPALGYFLAGAAVSALILRWHVKA